MRDITDASVVRETADPTTTPPVPPVTTALSANGVPSVSIGPGIASMPGTQSAPPATMTARTPAGAERTRRELARRRAAEMFANGTSPPAVASRLSVSVRTAYRWRETWEAGGPSALKSKGPPGPAPRLDPEQQRRLESALDAGPAAAGYHDDPRWTLTRVRSLIFTLTGHRFSVQGVSQLLHRTGWRPLPAGPDGMPAGSTDRRHKSRTGWYRADGPA
jgi:transposase